MGLNLCIIEDNDEDEEIAAVDVGRYEHFRYFRNCITDFLESGEQGSRFPVLINHDETDGEWSPDECLKLKLELQEIESEFLELIEMESPEIREEPSSTSVPGPSVVFQSFTDVEGTPLIERMIWLCDVAIEHQLPILFQ